MGTAEFLQRIERAVAARTLDITFESVGDFNDADRELLVRVKPASAGGLWVFVQRHT